VVAVFDSSFCFVPCFSSLLIVYPLFSISLCLLLINQPFLIQTMAFVVDFSFVSFSAFSNVGSGVVFIRAKAFAFALPSLLRVEAGGFWVFLRSEWLVFFCVLLYFLLGTMGGESIMTIFSYSIFRFNRIFCMLNCASCVHMGRIGLLGGRAGWDGCAFWLVRLLVVRIPCRIGSQ